MVILGFLLTGLFQTFYQGLKSRTAAKELKQKILQLELFQQKLKQCFIQLADSAMTPWIWLDTYPQAKGMALFFQYHHPIDPDFEFCGNLEAVLFLSDKRELSLLCISEKKKQRLEILCDRVDGFQCRLFHPKKKVWLTKWSEKEEENAPMLMIDLLIDKDKVPMVFFLSDAESPIAYIGPP